MVSMTDLVTEVGGRQALDQIVEEFYGRVQADPQLGPFFAEVDVTKVVAMQKEFLAMALSGVAERSGTTLRAIHAGRGITAQHFSRFVGHFVEVLEGRGVAPESVDAVAQHLGLYLDDVVGGTAESG